MIVALLLSLVFAAYFLWAVVTRTKEEAIGKDAPVYSKSLPIIGISHMLLSDTTKCWDTIKAILNDVVQEGAVVKLNLFLLPHYFITAPEDAITVANTCLEKYFLYKYAQYIFGQSLLGAPVPVWKRHRKLLNPAFSLPMIFGFMDRFNDQAKKLVDDLDTFTGKGPFIASQCIRNNILKGVCSTTVGDLDMQDETIIGRYSKAICEMAHIIASRVTNVFQHSDLIYKICGYKKVQDELLKTITDISDKIIQKAKTEMTDTENSKSLDDRRSDLNTILNKYLELNANNTLTYEELREEVYLIIAAAFDTTSVQLENILHFIGSHTEIQERLYKEVISVIGPEKNVDKNDLQKLVYTDAVIKECLRLHPVAPLIARSVNKNVKLKNCTLRAGSSAIISPYSINRHPSWGPDANQFRPERWLEPGGVPNFASTNVAFSIGKRNCIGKTYAMTALKVMVAHLVRRYHIAADYTNIQYKWDVILTPAKGHDICLKLRSTL